MSCSKCNDQGWIESGVTQDGQPLYARCSCVTQQVMTKTFGSEELNTTARAKTFQSFTLSGRLPIIRMAKQCAMDYADTFLARVNIPQNSMALLGKSGSGKTHLMFAIANALREHDIASMYFPHLERFASMRTMLREDPEKFERTISNVRRTPVLLWDDLYKGRETPTEWVLETVMDIINYRYLNRLPVVISSERLMDELLEIDEAIGSRIYEMCKDHIIEFPRDGQNARMERVG